MDKKYDLSNSSEQNSVDDLLLKQEQPVSTERKIKKKNTFEKPKLTAINFRKQASNGPSIQVTPREQKITNKVQNFLKIIDNKLSGNYPIPEQSKNNQSKSKAMDIPVIQSNLMGPKKSIPEQYSVPKYTKRQQKRQDIKTEALSKNVQEKQPTNIRLLAKNIREQDFNKNDDQGAIVIQAPKQKKRKQRKKQSQVNKLDTIAKRYGIYSKLQKIEKRPKQLQPIVKQPERQLALKAAKQFLSGRVSIVWIFVIKQQLSQDVIFRIKKMYSATTNPQDDTQNSKYVPLCKNAWEIQELLKVPNCLFKIVTDLNNAYGIFKFKSRKQIVQFYIFNNQGKNGFTHALSYKCGIRKVKGIEHSLEKLLNRAQQEVENELQMFKLKNGLIVRKSNRKFPSFLRLSGADKTQATLYRSNLYGALKISVKQKKIYLKYFMDLVEEKYDRKGTQGQNIKDYESFNHLTNIHTHQQSQEIVKFYIKQSFYYSILNSMLRTMKTTEQFKPCVLPFNETYHAIKMFYQKDLLPTRKLPQMTLYRGTRLKTRDFLFLKPGVFVQMFGFMSTSKKQQQARKFLDSDDSYMFVIHINERTIPEEYDKYDHGFVDVNNHKLAGEFAYEEQILFNALNIFQVVKIQQSRDYHYIHLQYGVIFDLLKKKKNSLTADEREILVNYKYCMSLQDKIQDQGDVYLLANEYEQSKKYYQGKIKDQKDNANAYLKLANVQHQCGEIQQAQKNAQISLDKTLQKIDKNDRQTYMKVFGIHTVNAEINLQKEDFLTADESLEKALELLDQGQDDFERAKKYRELGQIKFKKGEIKQSEKQLAKSEEIFFNLMKEVSQRKWDISKNYYKQLLTFLCLGPSYAQIQHQRQQQMKKVEEIHQKALALKDQINMELLKLSKAQQDVYEYAEDKEQYQKHVQKALSYLANIKAQQTKDPFEKAHFNVIQATVQGYLELAQSEKLLNQAIALIQSSNPYDPKVAQYSQILAKFQKCELQKLLNPKVMDLQAAVNGKISYNQQERKQIYNRCKDNYHKALNVLLYNNKSEVSAQVLSIKNDMVQLDFNESNFKQCQQIIKQTKELANKNNTYHTEVAKANFLLSKISLSRGQTKRAFQSLQEAYNVLRRSLVKKQETKYIAIFEKSEHHLSILLLKSKIFQKQMKYDLALIQIKLTEDILRKKLNDQLHTLFAQMYEQYASYLVGVKNIQEFDVYFEKALQIRTQQMGAFNLPNAICRCNFAVHLLLANDSLAANEQLKKSVEIFSKLSEQNPIIWILQYTSGIFSQFAQNFQQATAHYEKSLEMAQRKLDDSHISISKIQFLIGKSLVNQNKFQEAYEVLQDLQGSLTTSLRQSNYQYDEVYDDQRFNLTKNVYKVLTQSSIRQSLRSEDIRGSETANERKQIYQQRMGLLKKTYTFLE